MKISNLYIPVQRFAARVLFIVWLLASSGPQSALAVLLGPAKMARFLVVVTSLLGPNRALKLLNQSQDPVCLAGSKLFLNPNDLDRRLLLKQSSKGDKVPPCEIIFNESVESDFAAVWKDAIKPNKPVGSNKLTLQCPKVNNKRITKKLDPDSNKEIDDATVVLYLLYCLNEELSNSTPFDLLLEDCKDWNVQENQDLAKALEKKGVTVKDSSTRTSPSLEVTPVNIAPPPPSEAIPPPLEAIPPPSEAIPPPLETMPPPEAIPSPKSEPPTAPSTLPSPTPRRVASSPPPSEVYVSVKNIPQEIKSACFDNADFCEDNNFNECYSLAQKIKEEKIAATQNIAAAKIIFVFDLSNYDITSLAFLPSCIFSPEENESHVFQLENSDLCKEPPSVYAEPNYEVCKDQDITQTLLCCGETFMNCHKLGINNKALVESKCQQAKQSALNV